MQFRHLAAFAAFAVTIPAVSQAQLGGLVRKAKEAAANNAANKVVERSNLKPSNTFGPELTAESLDGVLRGLAASEAKINEADALRITRQKIDAGLAQSYQKYDKDREAYDAKARSTESCQDTVIRKRSAASQQAYMSRMQSDPAAQAKMVQAAMAVSQQMSAAQQRGDTA